MAITLNDDTKNVLLSQVLAIILDYFHIVILLVLLLFSAIERKPSLKKNL